MSLAESGPVICLWATSDPVVVLLSVKMSPSYLERIQTPKSNIAGFGPKLVNLRKIWRWSNMKIINFWHILFFVKICKDFSSIQFNLTKAGWNANCGEDFINFAIFRTMRNCYRIRHLLKCCDHISRLTSLQLPNPVYCLIISTTDSYNYSLIKVEFCYDHPKHDWIKRSSKPSSKHFCRYFHIDVD